MWPAFSARIAKHRTLPFNSPKRFAVIRSTRLHLRPIQPSDAQAVFAYRSDEIANQYQGFVPTTVADVDAFIARNPSDFNQPDTWFQLVIEELENGNIVGDIGLHFVDEEQCELGITLCKAHQGKGYATEALRAIIEHLFKVLYKHRIHASLDPRNTASAQLMERLGFRKQAHFKQSYYFKGAWTDDVVYGLLASEWPGNTTPSA